jgi:glycogen operon protein
VITPGEPWPLGARCDGAGTNFAVLSRHATLVELWIFDSAGASDPSIRVVLDRHLHRTGDIWHVRIGKDLRGQYYLIRAIGPSVSDPRFRFRLAAVAARPVCRVDCGLPGTP